MVTFKWHDVPKIVLLLTQNCAEKVTNGVKRWNFSLFCIKLCKKSWNWQLKRKIGKKFVKNRENIHNSQEPWQFIIIFLQLNFFPVFLEAECILPPWGWVLLAKMFTLVLVFLFAGRGKYVWEKLNFSHKISYVLVTQISLFQSKSACGAPE